ncbi:MAG: DUF362 domain-containing protein [Verrucomicrobia bacterium]|nr:DUF362 domain-containing protein [Verrucomicrobiota bacterium]
MPHRARSDSSVSRRTFIQGAGIAALGLGSTSLVRIAGAAAAEPDATSLVARPPAGFTPMTAPGRVAKATAKGSVDAFLQQNQLWPRPEVARRVLERAMMDFTGAPNLVEAMKRFIHKDDVVAIKTNGIAGTKGATMATNFELIEPVVQAVLAVGVPPERVTVFEQFSTYLIASRVNAGKWKLPAGVKTNAHNGNDFKMPGLRIYQGISTKYCRTFVEATAVINMGLVKDHGICGYTGTLKNITHGIVPNPHDHHAHGANPQIAMLYNHPIVTSRVRLHITDGFKMIYDGGPLDKNPRTRVPHGAVYVATDPVALDVVGWQAVDKERQARRLKPLADVRREPRYIRTAGELGLGVCDPNSIRVQSAEV